MITLGELTALAERDGVDAKTVERDYIICHVMASIAESRAGEILQFKGGTAIRLCHEPSYRYSADIDLNVLGVAEPEALAAISQALLRCSERIDLLTVRLSSDGRIIQYVGPTGGVRRGIKLDLNSDEYIAHPDHRAQIFTRYSDQEADGQTLLVYSTDEILAEKLRCVMQRLQCRDLYDIWWLTQNRRSDAVTAAELFVMKARHRRLEPSVFRERFRARAEQYRERWSDELYSYMSHPPDVDRVLREVERTFRNAGLI